jgi:hypothetical protein
MCCCKENCYLFCDAQPLPVCAIEDTHAEGHAEKSEGLLGHNPTIYIFQRLMKNNIE